MSDASTARQQAQTWLDQDPDTDTRAELQSLLDDPGKSEELEERFSASLEFGTAGLRGVMGAGPMRMNRVLVQKVSAGLADYVAATLDGSREQGIVVGYDGRKKSRLFAEDTAAVLLGKGFKVYLSTTVVPTPVVAFAVTDYGAAAGVMVTASHNPPEYNGYKVYWNNGAQIIPPQDSGIAAAIDEVGSIADLKLADLKAARADGRLIDLEEELIGRYYEGVSALALHEGILAKTPLSVAYTPMHGVGARFVKAALERAGLSSLHIEPSQEEPDGAFPTVRFPNPEEDGAMDRVFALAKGVEADLVLANDPDADRLAVALPDDEGGYRMLTGDQVGVLLADYLLSESTDEGRRLVATTIVSSQMLGIMADKRGVDYRTTLTGFKWIANAALDARGSTGARFVIGYEEALGYSVGELVRDKDGVSAVMIFCEMAALAKSRNSSIQERLDALYREYGLFLTKQKSMVLPGADGSAKIQSIMQGLRDNPPAEIGGFAVESSHDLLAGAMDLPPSNVLVYFLEGNRRIIVRPSGTEPKLKCYYEVREPVAESEKVTAALERAGVAVDALCTAHQKLLA
jgi:phosphomannomutase